MAEDGRRRDSYPALSPDEYKRLLDAVYATVRAPQNHVVENQGHEYWCKRVRGLFLLMRYSGLALQDSLTLTRAKMIKDHAGYRIVTQRTKTGTDISVLLPPEVAEELLDVPNDKPLCFFWSGMGAPKSICNNWGKRFIVPCFVEAKIFDRGFMKSHRLLNTFACELLSKGVSLEHVSKLLGHRSVRTTEKSYGAWVPARQAALDSAVIKAWDVTAMRRLQARRQAT